MIEYDVAKKNSGRVISEKAKNRYLSCLKIVRVESIVPGMSGRGSSSPLMCNCQAASGCKGFDVYRLR